VLLRNLGIYHWHIKNDLEGAARYYARAIQLSPNINCIARRGSFCWRMDYRLYTDLDEIYEEQSNVAARVALFRDAPPDVLDRDTVRARRALFYIEQSQPAQALALLVDHTFKPWEGGVVIHNLFVRANLQQGKMALAAKNPQEAAQHFQEAMRYPENLGTGEPAQPQPTEQLYWLGIALNSQGKTKEAAAAWHSAITEAAGKDDVFSALALRKLGQEDLARQMLERCIKRANRPGAEATDELTAGLASHYLADNAKAQGYFRRALMLDPLFWEARVATAERAIFD
jgi:tetratricopeptide (TPR) repeat protein